MRIDRDGFSLRWMGLILIVVALGAGGLLFAWSGLFNVAASTGHWPITEWFLHWAMRNSVQTHAFGIDPPPLADPALVHRGAGHYASGCASCHGAPGEPQSPIALKMTPQPPLLGERVDEWARNELFWIVKHGVKYTGMPAWAARHRDDEVWSMIAFLEKLPELTPAEYRQLAFGPTAGQADGGEALAAVSEPAETGSLQKVLSECARCHGRDGAGRGVGAFPILTGQTEAYLLASLEAYAEGRRHSGFMEPATSGLDAVALRALAAHYADAEALIAPQGEPADPELLRRGETIATRGVPEGGVPACAACHGPKKAPRRPIYPRLAGQHADYLARQIELFQQEARGGTPFSPVMQIIAPRLSAAQIRAVTVYYASLERPTATRDSSASGQ